MIRFLVDENFNRNVVHGLLQRSANLEVVLAQEVGLEGARDPVVLAWAARERRVLLTHDVNTMTRFAYDRVRRGEPMPGVVAISSDLPVGRAIEELLLLVEGSLDSEWENQIRFLPL